MTDIDTNTASMLRACRLPHDDDAVARALASSAEYRDAGYLDGDE